MHEVIDKSAEEKEKTFLAICRQFRPAFRYFFLESFADPSDWMQARLAYTRGMLAR
jgi:phosphatidylinositol kinase/protein kinase (PI-3  family)